MPKDTSPWASTEAKRKLSGTAPEKEELCRWMRFTFHGVSCAESVPKNYHLRINHNFTGVLEGCADRNSTWINTTIHNTFAHLHLQGYAHSVEVWREDKLCGGLYGLAIGTGFFCRIGFFRMNRSA